jgi:TetR/AcrR family transcriptional regulator, transcriptional repressor for nem operon
MVGTLQFARATPDVTHAKQILEEGVKAALLLARAPST